jgi:putative membrane protein
MNRTIRIAATASIALALAACDRADETAISNETDNASLANASGGGDSNATAPVAAADFVNQVAASDRFEIESGQLAANKATSAEVKTFAQMLVRDHQKSTADLKAAAAQATPQLTPDPALDAEKQGMLSGLQAANGADFDRLFIEQQLAAHEKALALLQSYSAGGDSESLRGFAAQAASVVEGHLEKVRGLRQ